MPEAWELGPADKRAEEQLAIFILFCEDENDEPYYFKSFEADRNIKINYIPNQRKARLNINSALTHCKKAGLIESLEHEMVLKKDIPENIWCVFDRDVEHNEFALVDDKEHVNFTTSIKLAKHAGLKVAWSNDAFELWVLLHFEDVQSDTKIHRNHVYERLTTILKEISPEINAKFKDSIAASTFNYKTHLKRRDHFLQYVLPLLKVRTAMAISNAEKLEKKFEGSILYHDCNPCTKVHHLVKELMAYPIDDAKAN